MLRRKYYDLLFFTKSKLITNNNKIKVIKVMKRTFKVSIVSVALIVCSASVIFASEADAKGLYAVADSAALLYASVGGLIFALAFSLSAVPASVLAGIRKWHGSIDDQFDNINNLVNTIEAHSSTWTIPADLLAELTSNRDQLQLLINKCRSNSGSASDRTVRNSLLKSTASLCLTRVKSWSYGEYYAGVMTIDDVHLLGFLLPGETGGHHGRTDASDTLAEVKVKIISEDFIRVVIDQSVDENAARVRHGWPNGVSQALIVILSADGKTEILRRMTTRLHTDIQMPANSRGKLFIAKAAFLKHVDDEPKFGPEPTFSMPLTTEDLTSILDRQHHEEFE